MESAIKSMRDGEFGQIAASLVFRYRTGVEDWAKKTEFNKFIQLLVSAVIAIVAAPFALIEGLAFLIASPFAYIIDAVRYSKAGKMDDFHKDAKKFGEVIASVAIGFITGPLMNHVEMLKKENMPRDTCFIKAITS